MNITEKIKACIAIIKPEEYTPIGKEIVHIVTNPDGTPISEEVVGVLTGIRIGDDHYDQEKETN